MEHNDYLWEVNWHSARNLRPPPKRKFVTKQERPTLPAPANYHSVTLPASEQPPLLTKEAVIEGHHATCLGDTGAWNFVDYNWVKQHGIPTRRLRNGFTVRLADGSMGRNIDFVANLQLKIGNKVTTDNFLVTHLDPRHPITLGLPWLERHIPEMVQPFRSFGNTPDSTHRSPATAYNAVLAAGGGEDEAARCAVNARIEEIFLQQAAALASVKLISAKIAEMHGLSTVSVSLPPEFAQYADVFDLDYDRNPPRPLHGVEFTIKTKDNKLPPPATPYPQSAKDDKAEQEEITKLLKLDRIEPSASPTAAATFFVNKQCEGCHQLRCTCGAKQHPRRWVVDFRPLNTLTPQDAYPLPSIPELLNVAPGHKWYIKFDIDSAFHLVMVAAEDRHKTAFVTARGLFQYKVMPFGLKNAPATFQRLIDSILAPVRHFCRAFMDDGIVWADSREELVSRFTQVLELIRQAGLRIKLSKCEFFQSSVHFLGHIIGQHGTSTDPEKTRAIVEWPEPRTKTDIRGFNGLAQYYREYYPGYSKDAAPLTELTKDSMPNHFPSLPPEALAAFNKIKNYWSTSHHLATYQPHLPTDLFTDASSEAWGGSIEQLGKPLAFGSGKFSATERRWPTTDRELFACLQMHKKFPHLLQGNVTWWTDHKALESLKTTLANSPRRVHWSETLNNFPFVVRYRKGKEMHVDGMTRHSTFAQDAGFGGTNWILEPDKFENASPAAAAFAAAVRQATNTSDPTSGYDL